VFRVQPEDGHYQAPKHVVISYVENTLYSTNKYRVSHEERSIFWEVIVSVIISKNIYMNMCPIPNISEIELFECTTAKLLIRKRYYVYVLFVMPVFIVQVTQLV